MMDLVSIVIGVIIVLQLVQLNRILRSISDDIGRLCNYAHETQLGPM